MIGMNLSASRDRSRSFGGVFGWLLPRRKPDAAQEHARALAEARAKWRSAVSEYQSAREAGDKRGMGEAHIRARSASREAIRLELGRS